MQMAPHISQRNANQKKISEIEFARGNWMDGWNPKSMPHNKPIYPIFNLLNCDFASLPFSSIRGLCKFIRSSKAHLLAKSKSAPASSVNCVKSLHFGSSTSNSKVDYLRGKLFAPQKYYQSPLPFITF
jgi:hypothetical protein